MDAADAAKAASVPTAKFFVLVAPIAIRISLILGPRHRPPPRSLFKPMPRSGPWHLIQIKRICQWRHLGSAPINFLAERCLDLLALLGDAAMSDLFLLTEAQMRRIESYFPLSHGVARVDDQRVISGIIFVIRKGLQLARRAA